MPIESIATEPPLRILVLAEGNPEDPSTSGSGTPTNVITALRRHGHEVRSADVELYGWRRAIALAATWSPSRPRWVAKFHLNPLPYRLRSAIARRAIARVSPDVVLQYGGSFGALDAGAIPMFLYCDSHTLLSRNEPRSWGNALSERQLAGAVRCQRRVYEAATGIFTFSEFLRASFLRDFGLSPRKVMTVHAGPNSPIPIARNRASPSATKSAEPTILFVGREFDRKGGPVLLEAFRRVRDAIPSARLVIAGPKTLDVQQPGVEYIGYLRKSDPRESLILEQAYERADVFCLPTRHEPFGIVILEAMFHGLPVVATDIWAIPEMVVDGETGFTVPRDDVSRLSERLIELLSDTSLARKLGEAGRIRAHQAFTWQLVTEKMVRRMRSELNTAESAS